MVDPVIIKSLLRPIEFKLIEPQGCRKAPGTKYFQVSVRGSEYRGSYFEVDSEVCAYDPQNDIVQFFAEVAANGAGWKGEKRWESPRCGISLVFRPDAGRHVMLEVATGHGKDGMERALRRSLTNLEWLEIVQESMVRKVLYVDTNELEKIASRIGEFINDLDESRAEAGEVEVEVRLELFDA